MVRESKKQAVIVEDIEQFILDAGSDHLPTFGGKFEGGIQCQQVPDEIAPCILAILESGEPIMRYLEIGVAAGGTTFLMNHFFHPERIISIDDNRHPKAHVRPYVLRDIPHEEIIGLSQAPGTIDALAAIGIIFDMILIDGDHSYDGVRQDVDIYREFLRPGGFMILHDSALPDFGVQKVVNEIKGEDWAELIGEYVTAKHSRPCGVALFQKGGNE